VPAFAVVGFASRVIVTLSNEAGHVPFVIVHLKTFGPIDNPVTVDVAEEGVVTVPVPEMRLQKPFPIVGTFPANVEEEEQMV
jgi:hypothetical protein